MVPDVTKFPCVEASITGSNQWTTWISVTPGAKLLGLADFTTGSGSGTVKVQFRAKKLDNTSLTTEIEVDSQTANFARLYDMVAGEFRIGCAAGGHSGGTIYVSLRTEQRAP